VTHELDLSWRNLGFFGRAFYFYDAAIMDIEPERTASPAKPRTTPAMASSCSMPSAAALSMSPAFH
jgi:hypothetical protein